MRRGLQVIFASILCFLFFAYLGLAQEVRGPKVFLKDQVFDFREVREGDIIEHVFEVSNQGDQTLEIKDVKPG